MASDFRTARFGGLEWRLDIHPIERRLEEILSDPDRWLRERALILKESPAATVAKAPSDTPGAPAWVLKQFRPRAGFGAAFKNFLRSSRAVKEIEMAVRLQRAGLPTARVVAAAERRMARTLVSSYIVMQEIPAGVTILEFLNGDHSPAASRRVTVAVANVLARLHNAGFGHSDLNPANFLVRCSGTETGVWLIDLEGIEADAGNSLSSRADQLRRLNRRVQVGHFTRLRFLKTYCAALQPPLPARELAKRILAGQHDWETRQIGGRRWKVRLHLVTPQARALMENSEKHFPTPNSTGEPVRVSSTDRNHPGFLLLCLNAGADATPDEKTIGVTDSISRREQHQFVLKLQ